MITLEPLDPLAAAIQLAGVILASLAGLGIFVIVWKAAWMIRDIRAMAEQTNNSLTDFSRRIMTLVEDHENRIRVVEKEVHRNGSHYEGPDRRTHHKESP